MPEPLDFSGLNTYSLFDRPSKVGLDDMARPPRAGMSVRELLAALPGQLLGVEFPELVERVARAAHEGRTVLAGLGAHVIKCGLGPVLAGLMEEGLVHGLAMNGACIIHDAEIAMAGKTSEDVAQVLGQGEFGAARETGELLNQAIRRAAREDLGLGESVGEALLDQPHARYSLLAQARRLDVPVTVHVAMGTDIIHIHPGADGAAIGKAGHRDFRTFCALVAGLDRGVYLNLGSAVLLPEVFLKALTVVRNLGHQVEGLTTANFDFIRQYRPMVNVVQRPTMGGGRGFNITGHHEIMLPLFAAALLDARAALRDRGRGRSHGPGQAGQPVQGARAS